MVTILGSRVVLVLGRGGPQGFSRTTQGYFRIRWSLVKLVRPKSPRLFGGSISPPGDSHRLSNLRVNPTTRKQELDFPGRTEI